MVDDMTTSHDNGTWQLVHLPFDKRVVGCRWVLTMTYNLDASVQCYKARLIAKGYTQTYSVYYAEMFSYFAMIAYV